MLALSNDPVWFCLRAEPKREHLAAVALRRRFGIECLSPRLRFRKLTQRGPVWFVEAMFPGYLFARCALSKMHRQIRYAHGVSGIVRFGDRYPTIEEEVLAQLRNRTGSAEVTELNYELSECVQVKITGGAFAGLEAVVTTGLP